MAYVPFLPIPPQFQSSASVNLSGGTLEFYLAGTSTPTNIFSDDGGTVVGTSVTLNASGYPASGGNVITLFRDTDVDYKVVLKDSGGSTLWTSDDIDQPVAGNFAIADSGSDFVATNVEDALLEAKGTFLLKTTTQSKASDTTLADDTVFAGITLAQNGTYKFEAFLRITQDGGDFKFAFDFSTTPRFNGFWHAVDSSGVSDEDQQTFATDTVSITTMTDGAEYGLHIIGAIDGPASGSATMDFQWAQNTSDVDNTSILLDSWMQLTRIQ